MKNQPGFIKYLKNSPGTTKNNENRLLLPNMSNCKYLGFSTLSTMSQLSSNCIAIRDKVALHTASPYACVQVALIKGNELLVVVGDLDEAQAGNAAGEELGQETRTK